MSYIRSVRLEKLTEELGYTAELPAVRSLSAMEELELSASVTYLVGENGTGKSTLLEAIAVKYGFNAEGGSLNFSFSTKETHSPLHNAIKLTRGIERPKTGFFLRAESFYNAASYVDTLGYEILQAYGGKSLHEQSHGESFFSLVMNRFTAHGLYILDEPEAALSPSRQMSLLIRINELVKQGSQFIIATHSPVILAYPDAVIYELTQKGIAESSYEDTETYSVMKAFMDSPRRMLDRLFDETEKE
ncbi:AAA family ATPase [Ruminococcus flavefaciens]|uniref:Predicted ATPase n=1 Tax=Ruminococcus flavefaciens TaxID=1265 RepID=A0A1M7KLQ9_RUMFL|nr:AAA family ATPase [Ruminococcus flavefaciens]SHM66226.1 Predicted ATPase [Ruminococcus flavefaciens]